MRADLQFGLENAAWPALLVDAQAVIRRCSQGAASTFGGMLESAYLSSIWAPGNDVTAEQFVARLERGAGSQSRLRLRVKGGNTVVFDTFTCAFTEDSRKYFVLQLLPAPAASTEPAPPSKPPAENPALAAEAAAHKQRLDCLLQLSRTVSLDFNNALTSILVHTSHILDQMEPNHPWRSSLIEAEKAAEKAAEITNDLAAFSRQEKESRTQTVSNLNLLLRRSIELFQKADPRSRVIWEAELETHPYMVTCDEAKMQQAFVRILENSVQALGEEGGRVRVITRNLDLREPTHDQNVALAPGVYVNVEVKDDGPGIPADVLPRVFEPFFTTKRGHRGLGLAWVYGIVTNHSGYVTISSSPGNTSVRLYIPAAKRVLRDTQIKKEALHGTETILLVDDEELVLTMGQMVLSAFGYQVLTAPDGHKALEIITKTDRRIDLLITDLVMPRMSGRELIENVKRIAPATRIIYCSGFVRPNAEDEEYYLQKPFTSKELLAKVRQVLSTENL